MRLATVTLGLACLATDAVAHPVTLNMAFISEADDGLTRQSVDALAHPAARASYRRLRIAPLNPRSRFLHRPLPIVLRCAATAITMRNGRTRLPPSPPRRARRPGIHG